MKALIKNRIHSLVLCLPLLVVSCAEVSKMPLTAGTGSGVRNGKSLIVGKISIKNANKPSQQPELLCVFVDASEKHLSFTLPEKASDQVERGKDYLVSMDVTPGTVTIKEAAFTRQIPGLIFASAGLPIEKEINVPNNSVVYIGHITATIIPKKNTGLPAAGPMVPLIDQAVAGFSTGAFKVVITDEFNKDTAELKSKHPELRKMKFVKSILPALTPK